MAKTTALMWIVREAKKLRRQYPNRYEKWTDFMAQASAIYSSKHHGHSPVGHKHKKKSMPKRRAAQRSPARKHIRISRKKRVGESGVSTKSRTHTDYNRNKVNITVGAVNKHKKQAREKIEYLIGKEEVRKFKAKGVRVRRKISKKLTSLKRTYRRLL